MRRELFLRIVDEVTAKNIFFKQRRDAAGQLGFSALHKCTVAVKMLAYGGPADELDDHLKMGEYCPGDPEGICYDRDQGVWQRISPSSQK